MKRGHNVTVNVRLAEGSGRGYQTMVNMRRWGDTCNWWQAKAVMEVANHYTAICHIREYKVALHIQCMVFIIPGHTFRILFESSVCMAYR